MSPSSSPSGWCAGSYAGSATSSPLRRRRSPRSATTKWPGCTSSQRGRHRPGEGLGVAVVKGQGPGEGAPPPHGAEPADGHGEPFLLLHLGPRAGAAFWKTNAYGPFPVWLWLNGRSWAQRQLDKAGIAYQALDNGFLSCEGPRALQRICDRLGPGALKSFFWRWQGRLPSPFTQADLRAGYVYELAFRQFKVSDTRVFDHPAAGRASSRG